jgi:hypothetical protein
MPIHWQNTSKFRTGSTIDTTEDTTAVSTHTFPTHESYRSTSHYRNISSSAVCTTTTILHSSDDSTPGHNTTDESAQPNAHP